MVAVKSPPLTPSTGSIEETVTVWSGKMTSEAQFRILGIILGIYRNRHTSNVLAVYPSHKKEMQTHLVTSRPVLKNDPFCNHQKQYYWNIPSQWPGNGPGGDYGCPGSRTTALAPYASGALPMAAAVMALPGSMNF